MGMKVQIYEARDARGSVGARAWLSTEHAASHYNQAVLLWARLDDPAEICGWADFLPSGLAGWEFLERVAAGDPSNHCLLSDLARAELERLLRDVRAWRGLPPIAGE